MGSAWRRRLAVVTLTALATTLLPLEAGSAATGTVSRTLVRDIDGLPARSGQSGATGETLSRTVESPIPFSMVGFTMPAGARVSWRTSADGTTWGRWSEAEPFDLGAVGGVAEGPDPATAEGRAARAAQPAGAVATQPMWVGEAIMLQVSVAGADPDDVGATVIDSSGLSRSLLERATDAVAAAWGGSTATAEARRRGPRIITRQGWGADGSLRRARPEYERPRYGILHHTAGGNTYSRAEADDVVRGIYSYHVRGNGWNDIGYNFLVDRFGRIYEGRYGGIARGVVGAHASGFNTGSFGVSVMGNFEGRRPPPAAMRAVKRIVRYKMRLHRIAPLGRVTVVAGTGRTCAYPRFTTGQRIRLNTLIAHRDVGCTSCPGSRLYAQLPRLRRRVAAGMRSSRQRSSRQRSSRRARRRVTRKGPGVPLTGDWDGDGRDELGWYRNGVFTLRLGQARGPSAGRRFRVGRGLGRPVVGDWDADGRDEVGVVRARLWRLAMANGRRARKVHVRYGVRNGVPVTGDWNGDGRDSVGVFRSGRWFLRNRNSSGKPGLRVRFGRGGDRPVVGRWRPGRRDSLGVRRGARWLLARADRRPARPAASFRFGRAGDTAVSGNWLVRTRSDEIGVVRGRRWYLRARAGGGPATNVLRWWPRR
ncbi:MAG: N-acetylmuramoyl-L-alanine amidase [Actinobacteria bacterium]|nr:N-acetylmuramoyl-L-alanine amidase [Actinomycetota bacterium]